MEDSTREEQKKVTSYYWDVKLITNLGSSPKTPAAGVPLMDSTFAGMQGQHIARARAIGGNGSCIWIL